ncbi:deoxyuridine 5'-triphosphate nucleotidohydrolase [Cellulophaga baltica 18]|uniref:Deoxyuridine 5'-triphosphate nucleotidohydrolase n=1 Tax=Cellulophaga baltica 18 TaxID=1348584 RepID=A0AAU8RJM4_9FLAO|nr:deoxyuridine 5'-triphosphate nucleotidohydrolase [Cellulophaga baltica 18]
MSVLKKIIFSISILFVVSCKSTKIVTSGAIDESLSSKAIIKAHYANALDFETISGKMKINYEDKNASQGFSVSLRMEKDKAILIFASFNIFKAYITPNRVSFYNKLDNSYFDGDFSYLSKLLGTELDFEKVQSLLLGQAILDLRDAKYDVNVANENYQLQPKKALELYKILFQIEPKYFRVSKEQISQPKEQRLLQINYTNYQEIDKKIIPNEIVISAAMDGNESLIEIEYKNIEFDRNLKFPYDIPNGFKEISLD